MQKFIQIAFHRVDTFDLFDTLTLYHAIPLFQRMAWFKYRLPAPLNFFYLTGVAVDFFFEISII
jgi:hypothetical protein